MESLRDAYRDFIVEHQKQYRRLVALEKQCFMARETIARVEHDIKILVADVKKVVGYLG